MFGGPLGLAFGWQFLFGNNYSRFELNEVLAVSLVAALVGLYIGSIAGLAARLPRKGVSILKSIGVVTGCGLLAIVLAVPAHYYKGEPEPSPVPIIISAVLGLLLGGVIVCVYGAVATIPDQSKRRGKRDVTLWQQIAVALFFVVAIGVIASFATPQVALRQMRPPFFHEYHQIAEEIYARYLTDKALPAPSSLSATAQKTLSDNKGITYSVIDGLSYRYDKPYPTNLPIIGFMTFGLCWGGTVCNIGESETPETLIHNANLRAGKHDTSSR